MTANKLWKNQKHRPQRNCALPDWVVETNLAQKDAVYKFEGRIHKVLKRGFDELEAVLVLLSDLSLRYTFEHAVHEILVGFKKFLK